MHLIYRSKKQSLPIVHEPKLAPYMTTVAHHSPPHHFQKKSIEIILDKHINSITPTSQALGCYKPQRKSLYRASKSRSKVQSGSIRPAIKIDHLDSKGTINKNKSSQLVDRHQTIRRRGQSQYSPYKLGQKKSGSAVKLKVQSGAQLEEKDWICVRLIQKQVYSLEEGSDFV